jgi:uncharacterized protein YbbK (DUF523 family)
LYIVSKCLLGYNCKYSGGNNRNEKVIDFCDKHSFVAVCPEVLGGLESPRAPAEIIKDKVVDKEGKDVTDEFQLGAKIALNIIIKESLESSDEIEGAILKANSPSCGAGTIYDGTFSHVRINGDGCFTKLLRPLNIETMTEEDF